MPHETPHPPDPPPAGPACNADGEAAATGGVNAKDAVCHMPEGWWPLRVAGPAPEPAKADAPPTKPLPRPTEIIALENLKGYFKDILDKLDADPVGAHDFAWEQVGEILALGCHDVQTVILARRKVRGEARLKSLAQEAEAKGVNLHDLAARCFGYPRPA